MKINHPCWKCEKCNHIWVALSDSPPEKCASSKCRSRQWNNISTKLSAEIKPVDVREVIARLPKSFTAPSLPEPDITDYKEFSVELDETG